LADIKIGEHVQRQFLGMTFNMDTIWTTLVAGTIVVVLGFWARRRSPATPLTSSPPSSRSSGRAWSTRSDQVEDNLGHVNPFAVALAVSLFFFILIANWLEMVPSGRTSISTSAGSHGGHEPHVRDGDHGDDRSLVLRHLRRREGLPATSSATRRSTSSRRSPPISLALRLFGNIFAGGILLALSPP
jgi:F-type H+-transporting ATPase subunit a